MNEEIGKQIGKTIGDVATCDVKEGDVGWGRTLRIYVEINLLKPIARG